MKLRVENLGPIKQAEIDLTKRFYVFVGYNNSGKTYMAQLLWNFFSYWDMQRRAHELKFDDHESMKLSDNKFSIDENNFEDLISRYLSIFYDTVIESFNANQDFNKLVICLDDGYDSFFNNSYSLLIENGEKSELIQKSKNSSEIYIEPIKKEDAQSYDYKIHSGILGLENYIETFIILSTFHKLIRENLERGFENFFLPANRIFYPSFYHYVNTKSKEDLETISKLNNIEAIQFLSKPRYNQSMDRLFSSFNELNIYKNSVNELGKYQDLLEKLQILNGGISIEDEQMINIEASRLYARLQSGEKLHMHEASSSINQLTALMLYFKYWCNTSNNFLMIDEPEINLHPESQIKLLDILVKFANRNSNRVLITTHSTLMTEAMNNHLHLGYLKDMGANIMETIVANKLYLDEESAISSKDVGIYFFDGETVQEYTSNEYGVYFENLKRTERQVTDTGSTLRGQIYDLLKAKRRKKQEATQNA